MSTAYKELRIGESYRSNVLKWFNVSLGPHKREMMQYSFHRNFGFLMTNVECTNALRKVA